MDLLQDIATVKHSPVIKRPDYSALRQQLPDLDFGRADEAPLLPALQEYRSFYNLNFPRAQKTGVGTFAAAGYDLVAQYWLVDKPRGTLFVCHGYFDHTAFTAPRSASASSAI